MSSDLKELLELISRLTDLTQNIYDDLPEEHRSMHTRNKIRELQQDIDELIKK